MTKTNIILNGENVTISATCKGTANAFGDNLQHYKFYVTIRTSNETAHFYFYYSFANWQKGITELSEDELLNALDCFLSDASCYDGATDFEDFCKEFGYTDISQYKTALRAYNGCKRHYNAVLRLFGENWYIIYNELVSRD